MARIVRTGLELKQYYNELKAGDCVAGVVGIRRIRDRMIINLLERGVRFVPSATSQTLSHSKVAQALAFREWMVPLSMAISRRGDLLDAITAYNRHGIGAVVTKEDHLQCGFGIHFWENIETLYNHASFGNMTFPFVLQPFMKNYTDVRAIVAGDYHEAYTRENNDNFRANLAVGGVSRPYTLTSEQLGLCRQIMLKGRFPYAHLDLLITEDRKSYLSEIALNGGTKGAAISGSELEKLKRIMIERMIDGV